MVQLLEVAPGRLYVSIGVRTRSAKALWLVMAASCPNRPANT